MSKRVGLALVIVTNIVACSEEGGLDVYNDPAGAAASQLAVGEVNQSGVMFDWQDGANFVFVERCPCQPVCPSDNAIPEIAYDTVWEAMAADPDPVMTDTDLDLVALPHPLPYATSLNAWDEPAAPLDPGTSYRVYVSKLPEDRDFTADELIAADIGLPFEIAQFRVNDDGAIQTEEIDEDISCLDP